MVSLMSDENRRDGDGASGGGRRSHEEKEKAKKGVRIMNQFRDRDALVYDLDCEGTKLIVSVSKTETGWTFDARAKAGAEPLVSAEGGNKLDAFAALTAAWGEKLGAEGFPQLDWKGIQKALTDVRAI